MGFHLACSFILFNPTRRFRRGHGTSHSSSSVALQPRHLCKRGPHRGEDMAQGLGLWAYERVSIIPQNQDLCCNRQGVFAWGHEVCDLRVACYLGLSRGRWDYYLSCQNSSVDFLKHRRMPHGLVKNRHLFFIG